MASEQKIFERGQNLYFTEEMSVQQLVAVLHERLVEIPDEINFCLIVGPVRTGTTVIQLLASHLPSVIFAEFQPFKYLLRHGLQARSFSYDRTLFPNQSHTIVIKETLGPDRELECTLDPVGILLQAGIHPARISAVYVLREPHVTFRSWNTFRRCRVEQFVAAHWKIWECYQMYRDVLGSCIPFYYEALARDPLHVFGTLFTALGLLDSSDATIQIQFQEGVIRNKNRWNEAENLLYWDTVVAPMIAKGGFQYADRNDLGSFTELEKLSLSALVMPFEIWKRMVCLQLNSKE